MRITYPSQKDMLEINKIVLEEIRVQKADRYGLMPSGKETIRNLIRRMKSAKGDIFDKTVVLLKGIIRQHPFMSGNRRTAMIATMTFLEINGKRFIAKKDIGVIYGIRELFYSDKEINKWIRGGEIREFKRQ